MVVCHAQEGALRSRANLLGDSSNVVLLAVDPAVDGACC